MRKLTVANVRAPLILIMPHRPRKDLAITLKIEQKNARAIIIHTGIDQSVVTIVSQLETAFLAIRVLPVQGEKALRLTGQTILLDDDKRQNESVLRDKESQRASRVYGVVILV